MDMQLNNVSLQFASRIGGSKFNRNHKEMLDKELTLNGQSSGLRKHLSGLDLSDKRSLSSEHIVHENDNDDCTEAKVTHLKKNLISKSREGGDPQHFSGGRNLIEDRLSK